MKKRVITSVWLVSLFLLIFIFFPSGITLAKMKVKSRLKPPSGQTMVLPYHDIVLSYDGSMSDWAGIEPILFLPQEGVILEGSREYQGLDDLSTVWYGFVNSKGFNFMVELTDNTYVQPERGRLWNGDSAEIYLGFTDKLSSEYAVGEHYHFDVIYFEEDSYVFDAEYKRRLDEAIANSQKTARGHKFEFFLPFSLFKIDFTIANGTPIYIDFQLNESDSKNRELMIKFSDKANAGWLNPRVWGEAVIASLDGEAFPEITLKAPPKLKKATSSESDPVTIDGEKDTYWGAVRGKVSIDPEAGLAWQLLSSIFGVVKGKVSVGPEDYVTGDMPPIDASDLSADFYFTYDSQNLYMFVEVRDDQVVLNAVEPWRNDAVSYWMDINLDSIIPGAPAWGPTFYDVAGAYITALGAEDAIESGVGADGTPHCLVARKETAVGYNIEAKIPVYDLVNNNTLPPEKLALEPGARVGIGLCVDDNDISHHSQIMWGGTTSPNFWKDVFVLGTLSFEEDGQVSFEKVNSAEVPLKAPASAIRTASVDFLPPWTGSFILQYRGGSVSPMVKKLISEFRILNIGAPDTPYKNLKIRYWYTKEGTAEEFLSTSDENITAAAGESKGHHYIELGFTSGAGILESSDDLGRLTIGVTVAKEDNSYYHQSNDWSFVPFKEDYIEWERVALYWQDVLVWGTEPTGRTAAPYPGPDPVSLSQFKVLINTYSEEMDSQIIEHFSSYLQDGDIICVVHGNNGHPVELDVLNARLDTLQNAPQLSALDLVWVVLCAGHSKVEQIARGLSPGKASYIFYDYEDGYEPEFSEDFPMTIYSMEHAAQLARSNGFGAASAPTGRGLFDYKYIRKHWNYGQIANTMDMMLVQLQRALKGDYRNGDLNLTEYKWYLRKLMRQWVGAGSTIEIYPQLTVGGKSPNAVTVQYGVLGREAAYNEGFPGVSIWYDPENWAWVVEVLASFRRQRNGNLVWGTEPASRTRTSPDPVSPSAFKVLVNTFTRHMDREIINDLSPYLQDGDIICVVHGNKDDIVDLDVLDDSLNARLDTLQNAPQLSSLDLVWVVLCSAHSKLEQIAEGLSISKASYLFYDYEVHWEPEFSEDFPTTLSNMETAASICRNNGFGAGTAPTGRGLFDATYQQEEWDYGEIAMRMDIMLVQLQSRLKKDYDEEDLTIPCYKFYLDKLMEQLMRAESTIEVFPQITVKSQGNPNGAPVEYCINAVEPIRLKGFPGMSIWFSAGTAWKVVKLLDSFR